LVNGDIVWSVKLTYAVLIEKYDWADIQPVLARLYPILPKSLVEYEEAYTKLLAILPKKTQMRIVVQENERGTPGAYYDAFGRNGTLVKDWLQNEKARLDAKDRLEEEQGYDLSYRDWDEIKGMPIDSSTLAAFPETEIIVHIMVEITKCWDSDEKARQVYDELQAIQQGQNKDLVQRKMVGSTGFLQVWSEKPNGEFHGRYSVYWDRGAMIAEEGIIIEGNREGVWTFWDRNGRVERQIRYSCDKPVGEKEEEPWWDGARDIPTNT
jgi:hypothetical protein